MPFWYNVRTSQVETDEVKSRDEELMGPYPTQEEARKAVESARARTTAWDEVDEAEREEEAKWNSNPFKDTDDD